MTRYTAFCIIICVLIFASCEKKNPAGPAEDNKMGSLIITLRFADDPVAKLAMLNRQTVYARVYSYVQNSAYYDDVRLTMTGTTASGKVTLPAGVPFRIKVIGYDSIYSINYMGWCDDVVLNAGAISSVVVTVKKYGWIYIPGGTFAMGSETGESDERPVHDVTLDPFYMCSTEVNPLQWMRFIPEKRIGYWTDDRGNYVPHYLNDNPSEFNDDTSHPLENVTWEYAVTLCNRLSEVDGLEPCYEPETWECDFSKNGYRLPTEAEWEYACRAGTTTTYYNGDSIDGLDKAAWYSGNITSTWQVGMKEPNPWGLYDMLGNVEEWINDWYDRYYYTSSPPDNPIGPTNSTLHLTRGGGWGSYSDECSTTKRKMIAILTDNNSPNRGFRLVRKAM